MAELPGSEPALAPGAAVLDPKALKPAQQATPPVTQPTAAPVIAPKVDTSIFDALWLNETRTMIVDRTLLIFHQFSTLFDEHNARLERLRTFRQTFLAHALEERDALSNPQSNGTPQKTNFLSTIVKLHDEAILTGPRPKGTQRPDVSYTETAMYDLLIGSDALVASIGGANAYDPWNGWWGGNFFTLGNVKLNQLHIWEDAIPITSGPYLQHVQAVTQVDYNPKTVTSAEKALNNWFVSAAELIENPEKTVTPNYAINVFSQQDQLTGYVIKDLDTSAPKSMPHIGFLLEPDVLLWVALEEARPGDQPEIACTYFMFVEVGFSRPDYSGTYNIRGSRSEKGVKWDAAGNLVFLKPLGEINAHKGNYMQVPQYRDRESLAAARDQKLTGNASSAAIDLVLDISK